MDKVKVGVVGCGAISARYLNNMTKSFPFCLDVVACADIFPEKAKSRAEEFNIPRFYNVDEIISDPEIEIIVDLTNPPAHYDINTAALEVGKHVYTEKPLAVTRDEGRDTMDKAKSKGLLVGGAPDTILGAGIQTCRKLLDDGWIGTPITAHAFIAMGVMIDRYHKIGYGPMFDMGPYFIASLVSLLGPVKRVTGSAQFPFTEKTFQDPLSPEYGKSFPVETPTNVSGILDFVNGCVATITTTCDIFGYNPRLEIYGTEGILIANDPNMFSGPISVRRKNGDQREMPLTHGYKDECRGLGVADMAYAIRTVRKHRLNEDFVYHVFDIMHAIHDSSRDGRHINLVSTCKRPEPFRQGLSINPLDK